MREPDESYRTYPYDRLHQLEEAVCELVAAGIKGATAQELTALGFAALRAKTPEIQESGEGKP